MDAEQAWQATLGQLQMEMPKASFDTWVRDTTLLSYEDGVFTIGVRNSYACDWLENRLSSTVTRLLMGMMNRSVTVSFKVGTEEENEPDAPPSSDPEEAESGEDDNKLGAIRLQAVYLTRYGEIVDPDKVIEVPGYLIRLLPERGSGAFWSYISFHQVQYLQKGKNGKPFRAVVVTLAKYAGYDRAAFQRKLSQEEYWESLRHLVERVGGGTYLVYGTLPLSRADATSVQTELAKIMDNGASLEDALHGALAIPGGRMVGSLLVDIPKQKGMKVDPGIPVFVPDIARSLVGDRRLSPEEARLADQLHTKITHGFKDLAIRHYFILTAIPQHKLTRDQAALITLERFACYANPHTGEAVNTLPIRGGVEEMAERLGLKRPQTIRDWFAHSQGISAFLRMQLPKTNTEEADLVVRLLEPTGENDETWDAESDRLTYILSMSKSERARRKSRKDQRLSKPLQWPNPRILLTRMGVYPTIIEKLLDAGIKTQTILAWILFIFSNQNTANYAINKYPGSKLQEDINASPGASFDVLAAYPPDIIKPLLEAEKMRSRDLLTKLSGTSYQASGVNEWDSYMVGLASEKYAELYRILFD